MAPSLETFVRYFYSLFILSLSLSASAEAGELRCTISAIAKCLCEAPMTVKCGDKLGHIKNTTKVSKLKFLITNSNGSTRDYVLENPQGAAGDYISLDNELLKKKVDLKAGETIAIAENGLILDPSTVLFKDHHAKEELAAINSTPANSEYCSISGYEMPMLLIYAKGCGKNNLCVMKVKCELPKDIQKEYGYPASVNQDAVCPVKEDGSCPSPTECALDKKVVFENESIPAAGQGQNDKSGTSKQ
jgi:hypothetical protein